MKTTKQAHRLRVAKRHGIPMLESTDEYRAVAKAVAPVERQLARIEAVLWEHQAAAIEHVNAAKLRELSERQIANLVTYLCELFVSATDTVSALLVSASGEVHDAIGCAMIPALAGRVNRSAGQPKEVEVALRAVAVRVGRSDVNPWPSLKAVHDDLLAYTSKTHKAVQYEHRHWCGEYKIKGKRFAASSVEATAKRLGLLSAKAASKPR